MGVGVTVRLSDRICSNESRATNVTMTMYSWLYVRTLGRAVSCEDYRITSKPTPTTLTAIVAESKAELFVNGRSVAAYGASEGSGQGRSLTR